MLFLNTDHSDFLTLWVLQIALFYTAILCYVSITVTFYN